MKAKNKIYLVLAGLFLMATSLFTNNAHAQNNALIGREFYFATWNNLESNSDQIKIVIFPYGAGTVTIDATSYTVSNGVQLTVDVLATNYMTSSLKITSDVDIVAYAGILGDFNYPSADATAILPVTSLGTEYRLFQYIRFNAYGFEDFNEVRVIATQPQTEVYMDGVHVATLATAGSVFAHTGIVDLTGQKLTASKPVAVFSGVTGSDYIANAEDIIFEQMWPVSTWGKEYILVRLGSEENNCRVVSNENTSVNIRVKTGTGAETTYSVPANGYYEFQFDELTRITSDVPVAVAQYTTGYDNPSMMWVNPSAQRVQSAKLARLTNWTTWVTVLTREQDFDLTTFLVEGSAKAYTNTQSSAGIPGWKAGRYQMGTGENLVEVSNQNGLIAIIEGYLDVPDYDKSYIYAAAGGDMNLQSYFTVTTKTMPYNDTHYSATAESSHTFAASDNLTVKRTVENPFTYVKWFINGIEYTAAMENANAMNTLYIPASALTAGENLLTMAVRFQNTDADVLYTGKVWLRYLMSFGDAPESYDTAAHYLTDKLYLGSLWDPAKVQSAPFSSIDANTAGNDDALTLSSTNGYTDLSQQGFTIDGAGDLTSSFDVTNNTLLPANLTGWIDFNRNGVFDAGEAATSVTVPANSGSAPRVLTWTGAANRIMHGTTYLRLRLSTDAISQPKDTLNDGEVEDYMLNLKLIDVTKTAVSDNPGDVSRATLGDTITYTIHVENLTSSTLSNITVFDPIPLHSAYVPDSASPSDGELATMSVGGQTVQVIKWNTFNLTSGTNKEFSFKVAVTDLPQLHDPNDSIIANIAYALMNGDSIISTGSNCNLAEIVADALKAVADTVSVDAGIPINIDILGNDNLGHCNTSSIIVNISVPPASGGMVVIEPDKTLTYTAPADFSGNDSLTYTIQCNSTISTAKVRIQVHSLRPVAITDHLYLFTCQSKQTDVLANDANAASGAVTMLKDGTRGTATFAGGIMTYVNNKSASTCSTHGGKTDTVRYEICTPNGCARANVIVHILRIPRTVLIDSCSTSPYLLADPQYKNATYQWYKSSDGSTGWTSIPGATNARLSVTEEAWYKLEVTYNGDAIETAPVHFVIRTKHRLSSGSYWYDTTIN